MSGKTAKTRRMSTRFMSSHGSMQTRGVPFRGKRDVLYMGAGVIIVA